MKIPNIILDTMPLFDFLLWRFSERFPSIGRVRYSCLGSESLRKAFAQAVGRTRTLTTVPGVLAEVHGLAGRRSPRGVRGKVGDFWEFAREETFRMNMGEGLVKFFDLPVETLKALGPVDSSLIELARSWPGRPEEVGILADDIGLKKLCERHGVAYLWTGHLPSLIVA